MPGSGRLTKKAALVTGGSRGIGAAVIRAFVAEGAAVAIGHEPTEKMADLAGRLAEELVRVGGTVITVPGDLADPLVPLEMVEVAHKAFGRLDVVVANAATGQQVTWDKSTVAEWDHVQAVNVRGTWLLAKTAHKYLKEVSGSIITVTSVMVRTGQPGALAYTTSKAAIVGMTRALARELGPDRVRVNAVMPGAIRTEHEVELVPDDRVSSERFIPLQALKRRGQAQDLAGAFVFLASDEAEFITGQVLAVDGGWVMH